MMEYEKIEPLATAKASAKAMWQGDKASQSLGMEILEIQPGYAQVTMTVREDMVNGHSLCHGGYIFLLADSAFAFACNSHGDKSVAQHCMISFLKPGHLGENLIAEAREVHGDGRSGIYDITVTSKCGEKIAEFRGYSRQIGGKWLEVGSDKK